MPPRKPTTFWRQLTSEPALVAWMIYIILIPIYVLKNGLPQPGDMFILILLPMVLWRWDGKLGLEARRVFRPLVWFTVWVVVVDYTWMVMTGNYQFSGPDSFMLYPMYYVYNALIFLCAMVLYRRHGDLFLKVTLWGTLITVYMLAGSTLLLRIANRGSLFFNNPNQLGYYALLCATMIALTHRRIGITLAVSSSAFLCCGYLGMISASRAAVGGIAILAAVQFFSNPKVIIVTVIATMSLIAVGPLADVFDKTEERIRTRSARSNVDFFEERGYNRIWEHSEHVILGAGEGGFSRWDDVTRVKNMEIHSSAGTILFSYGILGSLLFLWFVWRVLIGAPVKLMLLMAPPLLYTIAHHGLRFTMLWLVIGAFLALKPATKRVAIKQPTGRPSLWPA